MGRTMFFRGLFAGALMTAAVVACDACGSTGSNSPLPVFDPGISVSGEAFCQHLRNVRCSTGFRLGCAERFDSTQATPQNSAGRLDYRPAAIMDAGTLAAVLAVGTVKCPPDGG